MRYDHGGDVYSQSGILHDFSINVNPLGMPQSSVRAITAHIADYARYPDAECRALRAALSAHHGVPDGMILCGNGASELIMAVCACQKPKKALVTAPTFSEYARSVRLYGGEVVEHKLDESDGFTLTNGILPSLAGVDMAFLCNPNNPTGQTIEPQLLLRIADECRERGVTLVVDECFIEFTRQDSLLPHLAEYPNLLILRAFTKIYAMAGLRLGMLYGSAALLERISEFRPTWSVSTVAQVAGLAALGERDWLDNTRNLVESERRRMTVRLTEMGITVYHSDANFLLLKRCAPLYARLKQRGILVRDCSNFAGLDGHHIRIGIKTPPENDALIGAIAEVING